MKSKPTKIRMFGRNYLTDCPECHECRKIHDEPCEELWDSNECVLPRLPGEAKFPSKK
jgi:Zn-dependent alcohol dehydrogenase